MLYDPSRDYSFPRSNDSSITTHSPSIESSDYECDATSSTECSFDAGGEGGSSD